MQLNRSIFVRVMAIIALIASLTILSNRIQADTGTCGSVTITLPFNDVMASPFFCQIAAAYYSGLTNGTTATTYSPTQTVTREQMAAFVSRTMDQSLKRGSRKAVAKKWWTPQTAGNLTLTNIGVGSLYVEFDGTDLWVAGGAQNTVTRVSASDGRVLGTWTGAISATGIVAALGKIFIIGTISPAGSLYMIDPTQPPGAVTTLSTSLGDQPQAVAFDGSRLWTANYGGSVSIISLNPTSVTTLGPGFGLMVGAVYDGSNIWVASVASAALLKLNSDGSIAQMINVGGSPSYPVFDGTNIWVPDQSSNSVKVIRVKDAQGNALASAFLLATLTGNGMNGPSTAAFDGERILVTNIPGDSVSLWKAADLSPLGSFSTGAGTAPWGACSDGLNFWVTLEATGKLARF